MTLSGDTILVGAPTDRRPPTPKMEALDHDTASVLGGSAYVFVADTPADIPPTITPKAPISLWPPNHKYEP